VTVPPTLSDLICDGLDVVFIGINPSLYSVAQGHYFARKTNRFWPCFSRSVLSVAARRALHVERLEPVHDAALMQHGFGFTDVAKRPSARADELTPAELGAGAENLLAKLERYAPRVACFHGVTGYRFVHRLLAPHDPTPALGLQRVVVGRTQLFAAPNPSPANAHFTPAQQTEWYDRLSGHLARA
jgi:double-stranded uracil-DNA glycosylase